MLSNLARGGASVNKLNFVGTIIYQQMFYYTIQFGSGGASCL